MIEPSSSSINQQYIESIGANEILNPPFEDDDSILPVPVSKFRSTIPQIIATTVQSLLLLSLGMLISAPTIVIPALDKKCKEIFWIDQSQASWFAGLILICQPVGSVLSGFLQEWIGRKKCMLMVNLPELTGWYFVFTSRNVYMLYAAACLMGFSVGFMEAPTLSYVGEISQPHLRGRLASFTSIYISIGYFIMYTLGTVTTWRNAIFIASFAPVITFFAILLIPESPIWLIKNNRMIEAENALAWLRGWVSPLYIRKELNTMVEYCEASKLNSPYDANHPDFSLSNSNINYGIVSHQSKLMVFLKDLFRTEMMRPLQLVVSYFFFYHCASLSGLRPYMVNVFKELNLPIGSYHMAVLTAVLQISGGLGCILLVHRTGKRFLSLASMTACSVLCLCLGIYSYSVVKYPNAAEPWIPFTLICVLFFCINLGINPIPWSLLSEIFPSRGRGIGGGLSAASFYLEYFIVSKTFPDLHSVLQLYGVFFFYGTLGVIGIVYLYYKLPETEGKKLEDVEKIFARNRLQR